MATEIPYHLQLFQTSAGLLRTNPRGVIHRLTEWLSDKDSPKFWAPFAYSIRGLAYENLSDWKMAKHDYAAGMKIFAELEEEYGKENSHKLHRIRTNVEFMSQRKSSLPSDLATPKIGSDLKRQFFLIEGPGGESKMYAAKYHAVHE